MSTQWQNSFQGNGGCMYGTTDYRSEKPPLTQLQELTSVFPSMDDHVQSSSVREPISNPSFYSQNFHIKEHFRERECDSGYATDHLKLEKPCDDAGYGSDRPGVELDPDNFDQSGSRECDSGFGPALPGKEEPDFHEMCGETDSGFMDNPASRETLADSDSGCADLVPPKWEEETPNVLPGFHQAFGSTEIGRFSRNDFFTNPSPPQNVEQVTEPPKKQARKPRSPRVKQVRKEASESPRLAQVHVPMESTCNPRVCNGPYEYNRYCPEYPQPSTSYPYPRNNYPSYSHCDVPYFRSFPFPLPCSQSSWSEPRWPPTYPSSYHQQPYPQHYSQPFPSQQPWTSANMYPYMRLDY